MRTLHPVLKRGDDDLGPRDGSGRRLPGPPAPLQQAAIAAADHDAWLVYGDAQEYGNVAYLTHYLPRVRGALTLVPREGAPILLVAFSSRDVPEAKTLTWVDDVRPFTRLPPEVVRLVRERDWTALGLGLVGSRNCSASASGMPSSASCRAWSGARGRHAGAVARVQRSARAAMLRQRRGQRSRGADAAAESLRPGVAERVALAQVDRALRYGGAEDTRLLIASGPRAEQRAAPARRPVLAAGDSCCSTRRRRTSATGPKAAGPSCSARPTPRRVRCWRRRRPPSPR